MIKVWFAGRAFHKKREVSIMKRMRDADTPPRRLLSFHYQQDVKIYEEFKKQEDKK